MRLLFAAVIGTTITAAAADEPAPTRLTKFYPKPGLVQKVYCVSCSGLPWGGLRRTYVEGLPWGGVGDDCPPFRFVRRGVKG